MKNSIAMMVLIVMLLASTAWSQQIGGGDITFSVKDAGNVIYTHDSHVGKTGLKCSACHYSIFARAAHNIRDKATMAEMKNGKSCGSCHNGQKAFGIEKNCSRCHQTS